MISEVFRKGRDAKEASYVLAAASTAEKNQALAAIADGLVAHETDILAANAVDLQRAKAKGMAPAMVDRLTLTKERIAAMAEGVRQVIALPDPAGVVLDEWDRPNGLHIRQVSVPLGSSPSFMNRGPTSRSTPPSSASKPVMPAFSAAAVKPSLPIRPWPKSSAKAWPQPAFRPML